MNIPKTGEMVRRITITPEGRFDVGPLFPVGDRAGVLLREDEFYWLNSRISAEWLYPAKVRSGPAYVPLSLNPTSAHLYAREDDTAAARKFLAESYRRQAIAQAAEAHSIAQKLRTIAEELLNTELL